MTLRWRRIGLALFWLAGAGLVWLLAPGGSFQFEGMGTETYYVVVHPGGIAPGAAFLVFAGVYLLIDVVLIADYRRWLGWAHFDLMAFGVLLILAPGHFAGLFLMPRSFADPRDAFAFLSGLPTAGYVLEMVGLVFFVAVLCSLAARGIARRQT